jgi:hypothetical protein
MQLVPDGLASVYVDEELERLDKSRYSLCATVFSPPPPQFLDFYRVLRSRLLSELPAQFVNGMYFYPASGLHCTCATLHGYTRPPPSDDGASLRTAWAEALNDVAKSVPSAKVRLRGAIMEGSAAYFIFEDVHGGIMNIRNCLSERVRSPLFRQKIIQSDSSPNYFRAPTIVHISFMRFRSVPGQVADKEMLLRRFKTVVQAALPEPLDFQVDLVVLRESRSFHAVTGHPVHSGALSVSSM